MHLAELKARLLRRSDIQLIIVSAPGGGGKTTLIKKLCHDGEIKGSIGFLEMYLSSETAFSGKFSDFTC